jgi:hypothetical protein
MTFPRAYAADDADVISRRLAAIVGQKRGICPRKDNPALPPEKCWCYRAGPDGETLPCPPRPET